MGVSLTVIETGAGYFTVGIIPHTWGKTMFRSFKPGDLANIETDVLAKYIERLIKKQMKDIKDIKIAIISATFHKEVTDNLEKHCLATLKDKGLADNQIEITRIPGALEIPLTPNFSPRKISTMPSSFSARFIKARPLTLN